MEKVTLTLTRAETDCLHSLLVLRRHAFAQFCRQYFHHSTNLAAYTQELKALEAKLMQLSPSEYDQVPDYIYVEQDRAV